MEKGKKTKKAGRMSLSEKEKKQKYLKVLYSRENVTSQKELAELVGVTEKTVSEWIEEMKLKTFKQNLFLTRQEQLALLYEELAEINNAIRTKAEGERFADSKLANTRRFIMRDIKDLETKAELPEIISASTQILDYVRRDNPEKAQEFAKIFDEFIKSKL